MCWGSGRGDIVGEVVVREARGKYLFCRGRYSPIRDIPNTGWQKTSRLLPHCGLASEQLMEGPRAEEEIIVEVLGREASVLLSPTTHHPTAAR